MLPRPAQFESQGAAWHYLTDRVFVQTKFVEAKMIKSAAAGDHTPQQNKCGYAIANDYQNKKCSGEDCCTSMSAAVQSACKNQATCDEVGTWMKNNLGEGSFAEAKMIVTKMIQSGA